jgi:rhodanese-related sulfurtransferase
VSEIDVTTEEVARRHAAGEIELVDIREPHEHAEGRIAGARHLPLDRLAAEAASLPAERPVVFYCRVGGRSTLAAQAFRRAGLDARSMAGGLVRWDAEGRPLEPESGKVANH